MKRKCNRCEYEWFPRMDAESKQCPKCKSIYWNKPRVRVMRKKVDK